MCFIQENPREFIVCNTIQKILAIIRTEHFKRVNRRDASNSSDPGYTDSPTDHGRQIGPPSANADPFCPSGNSEKLSDAERPMYMMRRRNTAMLHPAYPTISKYFEQEDDDPGVNVSVKNLKSSIKEGLSEFFTEVSKPLELADGVTLDLILPASVVLTYGYSHGVVRALEKIHKKRGGIRIVVAGGDHEGRTSPSSATSATEYASAGLCVTYISDAEVFAVMAKVDYVIIGTVAVLSSGSAVTISGVHIIALTAKRFAKPLFLIAPLYKLASVPNADTSNCNQFMAPCEGCPELVKMGVSQVAIPSFDLIPADLVTFYITDIGAVHPTSLYTIAKQRYHFEDLHLSIAGRFQGQARIRAESK
eukprot:GHVO01042336.1.p1 GENE.GHVO01042336.1~~GHVO01042336.1.p1  ORF type:complete len:363 (-),score=38.74 GHVO01042336.1:136-1224(-)